MPKVDFFAMSRPEYPAETKTFTDPNLTDNKGKPREITLTLRALDELQRGEMQSLAQKKAFQYQQRPQDENGEASEEETPAQTINVGGEPVQLNDPFTFQAASLVVMQCGDKADRYTFEEFIALAVTCPDAWKKILAWRNSINANAVKQMSAGKLSVQEAH